MIPTLAYAHNFFTCLSLRYTNYSYKKKYNINLDGHEFEFLGVNLKLLPSDHQLHDNSIGSILNVVTLTYPKIFLPGPT